jgi:hypothetical protein
MEMYATLTSFAASGWRMRRLTVVLIVVAAGALTLIGPVAAQPDANLNREVTGPFSGTVSDDGTAGCFGQIYDVTYQPDKQGSGSVHLDVCVEPGDAPSVSIVAGTFELTSRTGATLTGTVGGAILFLGQFDEPITLYDFTLTVTEGTGRFKHVAGTIALDGQNSTIPSGNAIAGTLTGSLQR